MAIIALEEIHLYGQHGCYEAEAIIGGHYELSIYVETDVQQAAQSDSLDFTVDYESVYRYCVNIFSERHNLLESLAYKMAHGILASYPKAIHARIKLSKLHPPLQGKVGKSTVDYTAYRN